MMKKILTSLMMLLLLTACFSKASENSPEAIKERNKLIVAMEGTWAPWTYHNESGELVGFDVEVAKYVADYMGVEIEYVEGEWDGLLQGVSSGRYDLMVNGCTVTEDRKNSYNFSKAYAYDKVAVVVKNDNNDINSMEDLNGKKTANTISSVYAKIAEEYGATVTAVDDLNQTILLLQRGDIDATLNAEVVYYDYVKANPNADIKIACIYPELADIAIAIKKGNDELTNVVNEAIDAMIKDGTLKELSNKYFGVDITN